MFRNPWIRRLTIASAVVALLVGVYALIGFLVVPRWLRSEATSFVSTHYHRTLSLGEIHFNPFTLTLDIRAIALPGASPTTLMLGASELLVQLRAASAWRRAASFSRIVLDRPFARVLIRPDGSVNLEDLAKPFASTHKPASSPKQSAPPRLYIDRLAIIDGRVTYEDQARKAPFSTQLEHVTLDLRDFSTVASTANAYTLDFATALGARFHWSGDIEPSPVASRGQFSISGLEAHTLWSYLRAELPFELSSGSLALAGSYDLAVGTHPDLEVDLQHLEAHDFGVRPPGAPSDYLDLKLIDVGDSRVSLAHHSISVGPIHLTGGSVHAWLDAQGQVNLAALLGPASPPAPSGAPAPASPAWSISAPDIAISGLGLTVEDRALTPAVTLTLDPLSIDVKGYHTPGDPRLAISTSASVNRTGRLAVHGTYTLGSGAAQLDVSIDRIDLVALQPFVAKYTALDLRSGELAAKLHIAESANGDLSASGSTTVAHLRTIDDQLRRDFIKWNRLTLAGIRYRSHPASLSIRKITAVAPYARVIVSADRKLNIAEALSPRGARRPGQNAGKSQSARKPQSASEPQSAGKLQSAGKPGSSALSSMAVSIGQIAIRNGSAHYTDLWIEPHFYLAIQGLSGTVAGLSSEPSSRATIDLKGKVDRYAPISISGKINPFGAAKYTDMTMSFHGVELTTASPYSAHFAGYQIKKGTISADITYHIENGKLSANHKIVIDQLQLGQKVNSPDAVHWPLKLAVALLKDRHGVINIGLPISGSLDDPEFRLGPLIWKVAVNLIVKAATAPFSWLGKLVGGGEQMKYVDFDAGSDALDPASRSSLEKLVKALAQRPALKLNVPSSYDPKLDRQALARQQVLRQITGRERSGRHGKRRSKDAANAAGTGNATAAASAAALADPTTRFRLLVADYRKVLGAQQPLPGSAQAILDAQHEKHSKHGRADTKSKQGQAAGPAAAAPPSLQSANEALEAALASHIPVTTQELQRLGRHRARAIQGVLLGGTHLDPSRIFILGPAPTAQADGKRTRLQLGLQ